MGHIPVRRCLACRRAASRTALVRLAVVGETVTVDRAAREPGRGAYVCRERACLEAALQRGAAALLRALRCQRAEVTVDEDELRRQWSTAADPPRRAEAEAPATSVASASRSVE